MSGIEHRSTDLQQLLQQGRDRLSGAPAWLEPVRQRGATRAAGMTLPSRKEEAWRYTSLDFLGQSSYRPMLERSTGAVSLGDIDGLLLKDSDALCLPFVNGYLARGLLSAEYDTDGISVVNLMGDLGEVPQAMRRKLDAVAEHRHLFSVLNSALMSDGALIHVPEGVRGGRPIEILHICVGTEAPGISHPRHLIVLEDGASAQLIERYCAIGDGVYFSNAVVEVALGRDSELVHARVQEESINAQHLSDVQVQLAEGSRYRLTQAALGGAWSRTDLRVEFTGEHAQAELAGLMLAGGRQLNDVHLDVQHRVPNCSSRETFKSILDGKGRVVFDGHILVDRQAQKTDAVLANDNLMLSRSAEVDTKPQLEIYADDVKCSHGTTVGELDGDMLFYLRSRGIPEAEAKQMLCRGFAEAVVQSFDHPALHSRVSDLLARRLVAA